MPGPAPVSTPAVVNLAGLTPQTEYHFRVVASNGVGTTYAEDRSFTTLPAVGGVKTEPATNLTPTSALLHGSFVGNGEDTHYYFEWGTDPSYGHTVPLPPGTDAGAPTGPGSTPAPAELTGLTPASVYNYRIVTVNVVGTTFGGNETLTTPPAVPVVTESVTNVNSDSALLHAQINPGGGETTYHFEYATADEYDEATETYGHNISR